MKIKSILISFFLIPLLVFGGANLNKNTPRLSWVKQQVSAAFTSGVLVNGQKISDILKFQEDHITASNLLYASGEFLEKGNTQLIITVPCEAKTTNLGWETNLLLLIEQLESGEFQLQQIQRGDVAYQNSVIDANGDGIDEVKMVNRTQCDNGSQKITYSIFSFITGSPIYQSETIDIWSCNKEVLRKKLKKGDLMYSMLSFECKDVNNDGTLEIIETWIELRYNGGRKVADIEQKKSTSSVQKVLYFSNGKYTYNP